MRRIIITIGILIFLNFYVFAGYKVLIQQLDPRTNLILKIVYWLITGLAYASLVFTMLKFQGPPTAFWPKVALSFFFIFLIVQLIWGLFMAIDDVVRLVQWVIGLFQKSTDETVTGITRKTFLMKSGALLASSFGVALTYGVIRGSHRYQIVKQKLVIPNLPDAFKGMKLLQISDIHSGSFWNKDAVQKGVDLIKEQNADMVFFTGDIVNNDPTEMDPYIDMFSEVKAPMGVYSTLGNHDYGEYVPTFKPEDLPGNIAAISKVHERLGWRLLMNEHEIIEKDGHSLAVVGIENWGDKMHFKKYGDLSKAIDGVDHNIPTLLLSHDPSHWKGEVLKEYPQVDAMFSGHTHGMQFGIETAGWKWSPSKYLYPEWAGLYEEGNQKLYVNRGFGYLGFPGRLGIWPEITVFELA